MTKPVAHISLFAGIGGIDLAAEREGIPTILTAEIDDWCRKLLQKRFPNALHLSDVKKVQRWDAAFGDEPRPLLVSGGFPCPGISNAGTKLGLADVRSGLWSEFDRVIRQLQPEYVLIENVPALRKRGMDVVLNDLYYAGYNAWWDCFPASYFGAPHERDRIWIQARRQDTLRFGGDAPLDDEAPLLGVLDRIPRAGRFIDGVLYEQPPQASLSAVRRGRQRYPVPAADLYVPSGLEPRSWPTPTRADGTGGPGTSPRRTGGMNLRTAVVEHGFRGSLSPIWVEWLMGFPVNWTDTRATQLDDQPWGSRKYTLPTAAKAFERRERLRALGNAAVPRVAQHAIQELLRRS